MRCRLELENARNELNKTIRAYLKLKKNLQCSRGAAFNPKPDVGRTFYSSSSSSNPTKMLPSSTRVG
jgi:hypothetical protein